MKTSVILCLLVLCSISCHCKVAILDDNLKVREDVNNVHDKSRAETGIFIELATIKPNPTQNEVTDSNNAKPIENGEEHNCTTNSEIVNNTIDSNEVNPCSPPKIKIDNGTALILTPFIKEGRIQEARSASRVNPELFLGIESYSGFFTVNETYDSNLFFWYFPVENKPVNETPWIIWLQGGPGASSMTGLFDEIGPFHVNSEGKLVRNPHTWHRNHSLLFIDNPVGTGYSFTKDDNGYTLDMDTYGLHMYLAVKQLIQIFPELRTAPLFVAGESYAGKYVPALAMQLHRRKNAPGGDVNLQGLIIGNGYIDPGMIVQMARPFYYFGLLETQQIEIVRPLLDAFEKDIAANNSAAAKDKWNHLVVVLLLLSHQKHGYNFLRDDLSLGKYISFLRRSDIKRAVHVGDIKFSFVNMTVNYKLNGDFLSSAKPMYQELLDQYRVLTYCGQLDQILSCVLTSENYRTWKWSASEEFLNATRYPYMFNNRLSGYHKSGGRLTEVVIRGAGHMAPLDAPAPTQHLVARWVRDQPLSQRFGLLEGSFVQEFVRNSSTNAIPYL